MGAPSHVGLETLPIQMPEASSYAHVMDGTKYDSDIAPESCQSGFVRMKISCALLSVLMSSRSFAVTSGRNDVDNWQAIRFHQLFGPHSSDLQSGANVYRVP